MSSEATSTFPSSQKRIEANRRNAKKSCGPRTAEGKNVARRNALKHGLTAEKLVVLGEDADEFQFMADAHRAAFRPQNAVELALANTFSLADWRRQRCASTEATMTNQYIRDRACAEAEGREDDVLNVGRRLFHDKQNRWRLYPDPIAGTESTFTREQRPGDLDAPERLLRELESTYPGCRWLLDHWRELKTHYHTDGGWRPYDMFKLIRLTGKEPIDIAEDPSGDLLDIFLACHKLDETDESPFCKLKCELDDDQYPDIKQRLRESDLEARGPTSREQARAILDELFERHTRRLARLARKHKADDRAEARERLRRLAFDPGQEADKVRRYEDIAVRRMTRVCEELIKLRRAGILDEAVERTLPPSPRRGEGARRAGEGAAKETGEAINDTSPGRTSPSFRRGECAPRAGEGYSLESRLQAVPGPAKAGTPTGGVGAGTSSSPSRGEGADSTELDEVRRAGEGYSLESRLQAVPGPAKAGTPTGGVGAGTSSSPRRGEGARRAGEGARVEHQQESPTDESDVPGTPGEDPTGETDDLRLESRTYENDVRQDCQNTGEPGSFVPPSSSAAERPSNPTARISRPAVLGNGVPLSILLFAVGFWRLVAGGNPAALSQSQLREPEPRRQVVAERASSGRTEFIPFDGEAASKSGEILNQFGTPRKRNEFRSNTTHFAEPAAQNEATAIWSDYAGHLGTVQAAFTTPSRKSAQHTPDPVEYAQPPPTVLASHK
jgi:hypothetical protein